MAYTPTIGLEIHSQLKTATKMFCGCKNDPDERSPNVNVCPICLGHPGTLPTPNKKAIESVVRVGYAVGGSIPDTSKFDRKNYFYPDLPKGYQISQYDEPLVNGGNLFGVRIRRVHLEEDTGRLLHHLGLPAGDTEVIDGNLRIKSGTAHPWQESSFVDFNRAGIPLMELVTEPDIHDAERAVRFAKELQLVLRYLGVSDADMEKGQMRVEANVSVSANESFGTKVEVKNINSFRAVYDAIQYEIERQKKVLEKGEKVVQETRGWDEANGVTKSQRLKEESHDYRYFPEPDIPPLDLAVFDLEALAASVPELPEAKRLRFKNEYGLPVERTEILVIEPQLADYFEEAASELRIESPQAGYETLFHYLTSDLKGLMAGQGIAFADVRVRPVHLAHLAALVDAGTLSSRMAKDILQEMISTGLDPRGAVKERGIAQISDEDAIASAVKEVIAENESAVLDYKKGKENALQFLIGKAMPKMKGRANPDALREAFKKYLA